MKKIPLILAIIPLLLTNTSCAKGWDNSPNIFIKQESYGYSGRYEIHTSGGYMCTGVDKKFNEDKTECTVTFTFKLLEDE